MEAHSLKKCIARFALVVAATAPLVAGTAFAQEDTSLCHKPGTFNIYPFGQFLFGDHIKHSIGAGFGIGYNLCEQGAVTLEGYVGDLDTRINGINGVGTIYDATVNFEYKIIKGARFSPYVTVGVGMFNYDSKDFDPNPVALNVSGIGVMGGGGVGVSYDFCKHFFCKACFRVWGTSVHNADVLYGPTVAVGYSF